MSLSLRLERLAEVIWYVVLLSCDPNAYASVFVVYVQCTPSREFVRIVHTLFLEAICNFESNEGAIWLMGRRGFVANLKLSLSPCVNSIQLHVDQSVDSWADLRKPAQHLWTSSLCDDRL